MAEVVAEMDQKGPESPLQGEETYFDGSLFTVHLIQDTGLVLYHSAL